MNLRNALTVILLAMGLVFSPSAWAQEKPFTEQQVLDMVRAGLGKDSGAKLIVQRGIDFAPTEAYIQILKATGAKDLFLKAVRERMPINPVQIIAQLAAESPCQRVTLLVKDRGIDFAVKDHYLQQVRLEHFHLLCIVLGAKKEAFAIGAGNRVKGALGRPK
jgi:hypothetical protein